MTETIQWKISVPIFRNSIILKQLGIAIGLPFGIVAFVVILLSGKSVYTFYALALIGLLLFSTWLFIMIVYRGKYEAEFVIDTREALYRTQAKQAKKNRVVNTLAVLLGLLSSKPSAAGAGLLAQSRQSGFLKWSRVTKVKYKPRQKTILLRGGWMEQIALFCTQENYPQIERAVKMNTRHMDQHCRSRSANRDP